MASSHLIEEQPQSVSSFDSVETKAKSVELLENVDRFIIQRSMTPGEAWHEPNVFGISINEKTLDDPLLIAREEGSNNHLLKAIFCCNQRQCDFKVLDSDGHTVMWLEHPASCNWPIFCPSCTPGLVVRSSSGRMLGTVEHTPRDTCGMCLPPSLYYDVRDADGHKLLNIEGPACKFECTTTTSFRIFSSEHNAYIGEIGHEWQGTCDGAFSCFVTPDMDKTTMTFPMELSVKEKALLLGALFLTHINYFEQL